MRIVAALALVCLLPGCADLTFVKPVEKAQEKCDDPVKLPNRGMSDLEIEISWGRDRTALRICEEKRKAMEENQSGKNQFPEPSFY